MKDFLHKIFQIKNNPQAQSTKQINTVSESLLPPLNSQREYTLVLDMDETLIHYDFSVRLFKIRPYALQFLVEMKKYFEVVVFTASVKDYADWILN